jgi:nickel/cobalt transporter (NiCoT) family protein
MTLMDTTESFLMIGAYGSALVDPIRKLYYNLTTTAMSILVAVLVGGLESLDVIGDQLGFADTEGFWRAISDLNHNFAMLGLVIVGIFITAWLVSYAIYRAKRYDGPAGSPSQSLPANT